MRPPSPELLKSLERATSQYEAERDGVLEYLAARGIHPSSVEAFRLGLVQTPVAGHEAYRGRLAIPSIGVRGVVSLRFRCLEEHDCKESGCAKYLGGTGEGTRIFNVRALHSAGSDISITEGELDAVILNQIGVPAVAIAGANGWKPHYPRAFAGFGRVFVWGDGDTAGQEFTRKVVGSISTAVAVSMGAGQDVNSLYVEAGEDAIRKAME